MLVVVDTNVAVVANRKAPQASAHCVSSCTERLRRIERSGRLALDDQWLILEEYLRYLRPDGQPGPGDSFLKWILTNRWNARRCVVVPIVSRNGNAEDFKSFPRDHRLARFDPADRKFVAVALAHPKRPPILQAVDSRWWGFKEILGQNGVRVDFLCQDDMRRLVARRRR
jgi:hypothetical protein